MSESANLPKNLRKGLLIFMILTVAAVCISAAALFVLVYIKQPQDRAWVLRSALAILVFVLLLGLFAWRCRRWKFFKAASSGIVGVCCAWTAYFLWLGRTNSFAPIGQIVLAVFFIGLTLSNGYQFLTELRKAKTL